MASSANDTSVRESAASDSESAKERAFPSSDIAISGVLHVYVAFDWGEEIRLDRARQLLAAELQSLARRRRTPASIGYRPPPLRYPLAAAQLELAELGHVAATTEATVFDFGGVSVALHVPFTLTPAELVRLAAGLSDAHLLIEAARGVVSTLHATLLPAIEKPRWSELTEEYVVFQVAPGAPLPSPVTLLAEHAGWLAAITRLESDPLSREETAQAIQSNLSYSPDDLLLAEWSAALLIDRDCEETLQVIEFANLQLLEFRFVDNLLDDRLADAYRLIHPLTQARLPFWRLHDRSLRSLGELKIDANSVFERTGNALKLVGDQYLARVHRMLAGRFHLNDWEKSIERSLDVVQAVYQIVSDQSANYRAEFLEIIIIALIVFEIVMAFVAH